jgi:hypothetical protein
MQPPQVSVVIPTHNRPREVRRAIRSALDQTAEVLEVIVVDDGSTPELSRLELGSDHRIRLMRHEVSRGVSAARNTAISAAEGEWIALLDDDDLWHREKLAGQLALAQRTGADFVSSSLLLVTPDGRVAGRFPAPTPEDLHARLLSVNLVGGPSSVMVRRDLFAAVGLFDHQLAVVADWDMWIRLCSVAVPAGLTEPATAVLLHDGSMQLTYVDRIEAELGRLRARHGDRAAALGVTMGSPETDAWAAQKRWEADHTPAHFLGYAEALMRRQRRVKTIGTGLRNRVAPARAPSWIVQMLGDED